MKLPDILKRENFFIALIFTIALSLRIFYSFSARITPYITARHYNNIAVNLSAGKGYTEGDNFGDSERAMSWSPFYPFLLAFFYKIFGHNYPAIWIFQAIISALSCVLIYFIAKKAFGQKVARYSAIISAFCFNFILYAAMLLTETIYIFFVLIFFLLLFDTAKFSLLIKYAILGVLAGIAMLTRPIFVVFAIFLFFRGLKKRFLREALIFVTCIFLVISPWAIRNYIIYKRFIFLSVSGPQTFWIGNYSKATGKEIPYPQEILDNPVGLSPVELYSQGYAKGLEFIVQNPWQAFRLTLKKASLFFSILLTDGWWPHMEGWHRIFALLYSLLFSSFLFIFGTFGFVFSRAGNNPYKFWMRSFIVLAFLSQLPFVAGARYRLPLYPFMIIFAGYSLTLLPQLKAVAKNRNKKIIVPLRISAIFITLFLFNFIYDSMVNRQEIIARIKLLF